jgi:hypothetical protein
MKRDELRLECLKLASQGARDVNEVLSRATDFVGWVAEPEEKFSSEPEASKPKVQKRREP